MVRPKKDEAEKRSKVVQLRVTEAEQEELQDAAWRDHRNLSDWLRAAALDAARGTDERVRRKPRA